MADHDDELIQESAVGEGDVVDEDEANIVRMMVSTDSHLGFMEKDPVRSNDSFAAFDEVLSIAKREKVDLVLLAGDLFHENKPSRNTLFRTLEILRKYVLGYEPVRIQVISDQTLHFGGADRLFNRVNWEDPHINVGLPVFSIHGNHDDPSREGIGGGEENSGRILAALDVVSVASFINYFGRTSADKIEVHPLILAKGETRVALYGLGNLRDDRFQRALSRNNITFFEADPAAVPHVVGGKAADGGHGPSAAKRARMEKNKAAKGKGNAGRSKSQSQARGRSSSSSSSAASDADDDAEDAAAVAAANEAAEVPDIFSILLLHQNREDRTMRERGSTTETWLPPFLDLVIWGHEHTCIPEVTQAIAATTSSRSTFVLQPGSTVATSLSVGEAEKKHCFILEVMKTNFRLTPKKLRCIRPFLFSDVVLSKDPQLDGCGAIPPDAGDAPALIDEYLRTKVGQLIAQSEDLLASVPESERPPTDLMLRPLIRLKVDHTGYHVTTNQQRFGASFAEQVANPGDILLFHKRSTVAANRKKAAAAAQGTGAAAAAGGGLPPVAPTADVSTVRVEELVRVQVSAANLVALEPIAMGEAMRRFLGEDSDALKAEIRASLSKLEKDTAGVTSAAAVSASAHDGPRSAAGIKSTEAALDEDDDNDKVMAAEEAALGVSMRPKSAAGRKTAGIKRGMANISLAGSDAFQALDDADDLDVGDGPTSSAKAGASSSSAARRAADDSDDDEGGSSEEDMRAPVARGPASKSRYKGSSSTASSRPEPDEEDLAASRLARSARGKTVARKSRYDLDNDDDQEVEDDDDFQPIDVDDRRSSYSYSSSSRGRGMPRGGGPAAVRGGGRGRGRGRGRGAAASAAAASARTPAGRGGGGSAESDSGSGSDSDDIVEDSDEDEGMSSGRKRARPSHAPARGRGGGAAGGTARGGRDGSASVGSGRSGTAASSMSAQRPRDADVDLSQVDDDDDDRGNPRGGGGGTSLASTETEGSAVIGDGRSASKPRSMPWEKGGMSAAKATGRGRARG